MPSKSPLNEHGRNLILLVGPSGSGKSHMKDVLSCDVDKVRRRVSLSGRLHLHQVKTVTRFKEADVHPFAVDNKVVLVEIPSLDDEKTLRFISEWLQERYEDGSRIVGIIYLSRITEPISVQGQRNLHVFKHLCGPDAFKHVMLATTMWDEVQIQSEAEEREEEFMRSLWSDMIHAGASVTRFVGNRDSAWQVIDQVLELSKTYDIVLSIQEELVREKRALKDTNAAQALCTPLSTILANHAERSTEDEDEPPRAVDYLQVPSALWGSSTSSSQRVSTVTTTTQYSLASSRTKSTNYGYYVRRMALSLITPESHWSFQDRLARSRKLFSPLARAS